jgi:hypothetical protein
MKHLRWQIIFGVLLIALTVILGIVHYELFHDARTFFFYIVLDIAFIPVQVLLVTLIIHNILIYRERRTMLKKLNMVIGAFFSEVGTQLLKDFSAIDPDANRIGEQLRIQDKWTGKDFSVTKLHLQSHHYATQWSTEAMEEMQKLLVSERRFLLGLLENQTLLEHEAFTDVLWAVFHLAEELAYRPTLANLPQTDREHIIGDIKRAYRILMLQWLDYMKHLKNNYPYLFSLAIRTNPFNPDARVIV